MQIKDIGILKGPILIFGGVYSNYQALLALKKEAEYKNIQASNIICTGDIVAYCAQPAECIDLIKDWGIHCIRGNVELNLINQADDCGCNFNEGSRCDIFSKKWYPYSHDKLNKTHFKYLEDLSDKIHFQYLNKKIAVIHGGWENVSEYIFKSTAKDIKQEIFTKAEADVILSGHSGIPFIDKIENNTWINAGVIGMPANDGAQNTWYVLLDDQNGKLEYNFLKLEYDFNEASKQMIENNLIPSYAETLKTGIWDNCEILPDQETSKQGKALTFNEN